MLKAISASEKAARALLRAACITANSSDADVALAVATAELTFALSRSNSTLLILSSSSASFAALEYCWINSSEAVASWRAPAALISERAIVLGSTSEPTTLLCTDGDTVRTLSAKLTVTTAL